jgi:hypothetical protein
MILAAAFVPTGQPEMSQTQGGWPDILPHFLTSARRPVQNPDTSAFAESFPNITK